MTPEPQSEGPMTEFDRRSREAALQRGESETPGLAQRIGRGFGQALRAVPGYTGYRSKEDRRDADRRVREHVVRIYGERHRRVEHVGRELAARRRLTEISPVEELAQTLRHFIARVETATYGYGGLFSDRNIDERALDQLRSFDESLVAGTRDLDAPLADLEAALQAGEPLSDSAHQSRDVVRSLHQRFDMRGEVVDRAQPLPEESVRSILEMGSPDDGPPPAYWLDDQSAVSILGDNFIVDARLDVAAGPASWRLFRLSGGENEQWLLVAADPSIGPARLTPTSAPTAPTPSQTTIELGDSTFQTSEPVAGQGELVGPNGASGYRPVSGMRLSNQEESASIGLLLDWGNERQAFIGGPVHPDDLELFGRIDAVR